MTEREFPACPFVVLHHTGVIPEHWDLMIAIPGKDRLATWRIDKPPGIWDTSSDLRPERIDDHRMAYLTYEGPVSGGRGEVRRVAKGMAILRPREGGWRAVLHAADGSLACEIDLPD